VIELNRIYNEDCLEGMKRIPDKSIDMILCDLPYGTTACKWDTVIPFEPLWEQYERIIKDNGAIVLTASQPFTTSLISSNIKHFKYCWVWNKKLAGNGILAKIQPLKIHEDIVVFGKGKINYFPSMRKGKARYKGGIKDKHGTFSNAESEKVWSDEYYPTSILEFSGAGMRTGRTHPTQKPIALFEYLIKTYTNEGETVLDNCMGSGTTAIACINTNRNYIGFELDKHYCDIANERIRKALAEKAVGE
jgi:site-specific DNA-methyltransferase (adenine-specific)